MENWQISENQKKLLDELFANVDLKEVNHVLDIGSGRTSLQYLTDKYPNTKIKAVIYPGDKRKLDPLKECVKNTNYEIIESDIINLNKDENYDVVLGHLFLGEATKFSGNSFEEILNSLFEIKTRFLILINVSYDTCIEYFSLLKKIAEMGKIVAMNFVPKNTSEIDPREKYGGGCLGLCIKFNK